MLKQADYKGNEFVFEVECGNCRQYNYMNKKLYLLLKKDWELPKLQSPNIKIPSEMNVIINSLERCGISWIIRSLSQYHKSMFGKDILFTPEISSLIATRSRFPLPQRWNNVYGVDPYDLLKRGYDRVLVVQRDIKTQEWVDRIYYAQEGLSEDFIENLIKKMKKEYDLVYQNGIKDPHYLKVRLEDLNNYTVDSFTKLMDFFNFPKRDRLPIIPITPKERNWESYSSILPSDQKLVGRLKKVENIYKISKDGFLEKIYFDKFNPPKIQLKNVFIIGPLLNKRCHFSENIYDEFLKRDNINVKYVAIEDLYNDILQNGIYDYKLYRNKKLLYPLSNILKRFNTFFDLIIIDECGFAWKNDVNIPVFYNHREFKRPPSVFYPNIAFFWHEDVIRYFRDIFAPHWCKRIPNLHIMSVAVNLEIFKPEKKTIKGISGLAGREIINEIQTWGELTAIGILETTLQDNNSFIETGLNYIGTDTNGLMDEQYREYLPKLEALWIQIPRGQYISKRIIEAMACRTLCFIKLENEVHRQVLESMGLFEGVHYINFTDWDQLKEENKKLGDYKHIVENAYKLVVNNHTYKNRVDFIIELFKTEKMYGYA